MHPEWLPLTFTPSPELYRAFGGDLDALVHYMRKLAEGAVGALREARNERPVIGAPAEHLGRILRARHRFTPGMSDAERAGEGGASRVVVLRDLRRGRPPKKSADPPA